MKRKERTISSYLLFSTLLFIVSTCTDPFNPDLSDIPSENELVVEGFITDRDMAHEVRLSRTVAVGTSPPAPPSERGANVQIIDQNGNSYTLTETEPGRYLTDETEFRAAFGNSYQLRIELADGEVYESDFQELLQVPPINDVWFERAQVETVDGRIVGSEEVVRFFTDYEPHSEPAYYRYEHSGTYSFTSELQGNTICWRNPENIPDGLVSGTTCYLPSSDNLPLNVSTYPDPVEGAIGFTDIFDIAFDIRFRLGYSILVKKYRLTKEYHDFLSDVREQTQFAGSIFDSPPTQIIGNIRSVTDPQKFALGFFSTQSEVTKRIFVPSLGAERMMEPTFIPALNAELVIGRCWFASNLPPPDDIPKFTDCCDCREIPGSTDRRPDFWPN